jgi:hypothetical protein
MKSPRKPLLTFEFIRFLKLPDGTEALDNVAGGRHRKVYVPSRFRCSAAVHLDADQGTLWTTCQDA